jgi:hypothetical protein
MSSVSGEMTAVKLWESQWIKWVRVLSQSFIVPSSFVANELASWQTISFRKVVHIFSCCSFPSSVSLFVKICLFFCCFFVRSIFNFCYCVCVLFVIFLLVFLSFFLSICPLFLVLSLSFCSNVSVFWQNPSPSIKELIYNQWSIENLDSTSRNNFKIKNLVSTFNLMPLNCDCSFSPF